MTIRKKKSTATSAPNANPAARMKRADARTIVTDLLRALHYESSDIARTLLLLRWLANHADQNERETFYIETEEAFAAFVDGVGEAVEAQMSRQLEAIRKGGAR